MATHTYQEWGEIVRRIRENDESAVMELYQLFNTDVRLIVFRHMGPDLLDDRVHDLFIIVFEAIRNGKLREDQRVMGYVMTVVSRQIATWIEKQSRERGRHVSLDANPGFYATVTNTNRLKIDSPEHATIRASTAAVVDSVMDEKLNHRSSTIVRRFYLDDCDETEIREELNITANTFRNTKSRALSILRPVVKNRLSAKPLLRIAAAA